MELCSKIYGAADKRLMKEYGVGMGVRLIFILLVE